MSSLKVHIVGASGSGTTTLARALAPELGATALDSDDYFWLPTQPPFTDRRDRALRHQLGQSGDDGGVLGNGQKLIR